MPQLQLEVIATQLAHKLERLWEIRNVLSDPEAIRHCDIALLKLSEVIGEIEKMHNGGLPNFGDMMDGGNNEQ